MANNNINLIYSEVMPVDVGGVVYPVITQFMSEDGRKIDIISLAMGKVAIVNESPTKVKVTSMKGMPYPVIYSGNMPLSKKVGVATTVPFNNMVFQQLTGAIAKITPFLQNGVKSGNIGTEDINKYFTECNSLNYITADNANVVLKNSIKAIERKKKKEEEKERLIEWERKQKEDEARNKASEKAKQITEEERSNIELKQKEEKETSQVQEEKPQVQEEKPQVQGEEKPQVQEEKPQVQEEENIESEEIKKDEIREEEIESSNKINSEELDNFYNTEAGSKLQNIFSDLRNKASKLDGELDYIESEYKEVEDVSSHIKELENTISKLPGDPKDIFEELYFLMNKTNVEEIKNISLKASVLVFDTIIRKHLEDSINSTTKKFFDWKYMLESELNVQEEPAQEEPVQEEPEQEEPVQEEPVQEKPVQEESVQEGPAQDSENKLEWASNNETEYQEENKQIKYESNKYDNVLDKNGNIVYIREKFSTSGDNLGLTGISPEESIELLGDKNKKYKVPHIVRNPKSRIGVDDLSYYEAMVQLFTANHVANDKINKNNLIKMINFFAAYIGFNKYQFHLKGFVQAFSDTFGANAPLMLMTLTTFDIYNRDNYDLFEGMPLHIYLSYVLHRYVNGVPVDSPEMTKFIQLVTSKSIENEVSAGEEDSNIIGDLDSDNGEEEFSEAGSIKDILSLREGMIWYELLNNLSEKIEGHNISGVAAIQYIYQRKNEPTTATSKIIRNSLKTNRVLFKLYEFPEIRDAVGNQISTPIAATVMYMAKMNIEKIFKKEYSQGNTNENMIMEKIDHYLENELGNSNAINAFSKNMSSSLIVNNPFVDYNYMLKEIKNLSLKNTDVDFSDVILDLQKLKQLAVISKLDYGINGRVFIQLNVKGNVVNIPVGYLSKIESTGTINNRNRFIPLIVTKKSLNMINIVSPNETRRVGEGLELIITQGKEDILIKQSAVMEILNKIVKENNPSGIFEIITEFLNGYASDVKLPDPLLQDAEVLEKVISKFIKNKLA